MTAFLDAGKSLWVGVILASLALSEVITGIMGLLLKGTITYDYLLTNLVVDLCLTPPVVIAGVVMHTRMQELHKNREEEKEKNRQLHVSTKRYRTLIEVASDAILVADAQTGVVVDCNRQAETLLEMARSDITGAHLNRFYETAQGGERSPEDGGWDLFSRLLTESTVTLELSLVRSDGALIPVESSSNTFEMDDRRYIHCALRDISERKRAEKRLRLLATAFEHGSNGIFVTDAEGHIVEINPAFTTLTGYSLADVKGLHPRMLSANEASDKTYVMIWREILTRGFWQGELLNRRGDGREHVIYMTISIVKDELGGILYYVGSFIDVTERRQAEDRIRHLAHHDPLTNLPNRFHLHGHLERAVQYALQGSEQLAVMFIDLDNFKRINDTLGHRTGDALLEEVARRLKNSVRPNDFVARLGGDEFVVVITGNDVTRVANTAAARILANLSLPFVIERYQLHSGASIGVAVFPRDGDNADALMKNADIAMYSAKSRGRNACQFFTEGLNVLAMERMELENDLRDAILHGNLQLYYQPQFELGTGRLCGFEALLRWRHPTRGEIKPDRLIPIAEETRLILPLGDWVLTEACRQLQLWRESGLTDIRMAINVSIRQLQDDGFINVLRTTMQKYAITGGEIELEITESAIVENMTYIQKVLNTLRDSGIGIAIDDFGTGHSSLARLKYLPIQCIKIDRSFIQDIGSGTDDTQICAAIITLAHSLNLRTVAEGVETKAQQDFLQRCRCDAIQGNLVGLPLPSTTILPSVSVAVH